MVEFARARRSRERLIAGARPSRMPPIEAEPLGAEAEAAANGFAFRSARQFEVPVILTPGEVIHSANLAHQIRHDCCIDIGLNILVRSPSTTRNDLSVQIQTQH